MESNLETCKGRLDVLSKLLTMNPTPLLREEVERTITTYRETLEAKDGQIDFKELDKLYDRIESHWERINIPLANATALRGYMASWRSLLLSGLFRDYTDTSYPPDPTMLILIRMMQAHGMLPTQWSMSSDNQQLKDGMYPYILQPLEEMVVDLDHVEKRCLNAISQEPQAEGAQYNIHSMAERCNWESLARMLFGDQELITRFVQNDPHEPGILAASDTIKDGLHRFRNRYFAELRSPSDFVLTRHARECHSKLESRSEFRSPPNPEPVAVDQQSYSNALSHMFRTVADVFGADNGNMRNRRAFLNQEQGEADVKKSE